ncbi:oxidoreductase [Sphingobium sp. HWE2-09]|uniref:oxidoreductase n=1 Tax=Sphingobium sp. HWE2-09 TaxID=3108390 RepID=UPI002DC2C736|nr:oxidoreductase [Sphingobium sp. HWE2-09]
MTEIGVGLIGYGLGGRVFHAPFVQATPGMALRAIVSRDAAEVLAHHPNVAVAPDVDTLLARDDIDLVIVCSPDELHAPHALAAIAAGKHVLVDKPFATSLADAGAVASGADAAGVLLTIFQNRRWDADFLTLRGMIDDGQLGRIVHFESHFDRWRPQAPAVWKEARAGGSWFDLGPHLVDQALQLFGMPQAVTADFATLRDSAPALDWFHVVLHYDSCRAVLHSSKLAADHGLRFMVHGTGGSWIKQGLDMQEPAILAGKGLGHPDLGIDPVEGKYTAATDGASPVSIPNQRGDYGAFWRALAQAVRGEGSNPVPAAQALMVMAVLDAGLASARERRTIDMDALRATLLQD